MTEVNITPEQANETQAHIDAMAAKADGQPAPAPEGGPAETPERPAWLPEKFATPEDMAKAYAEMERKQSAPNGDEAGGENDTQNEQQAEADDAANKAVEAAGLDMDALGNKVVQNGDLDPEDYEKLAKQGISKEMVQNYVAGQQAIAAQLVSRMHETVGGEDSFNELLGWAGENLSPDEIAAFNSTVDSGSEAQVKLALEGLQSKFKASGGEAPNLIGGRRQNAGAGEVFRSTAEVTKAMADPRYGRDPAYRADVMAKLARSNVM